MLNETGEPAPRLSRIVETPLRGVQRFVVGLLALALLLGIWGTVSRVRARSELARETLEQAVPLVTTLKPTPGPASEELVLPGNVQAFIEAPIYARTSGYLRKWYTDIGTPVKKGQLLAEIDTPEIDQQLKQAQHDLDTAEATARLAASTSARWQGLLAKRAVSQQDAEQKAAEAEATAAAAASARANVERLRELKSFQRVVAPFDGVVTYRNTDIGALITAGESAGALFRVANKQTLRVYVQVPEPYAPQTRPGVVAELEFSEYPQRTFPATVIRTAQALDPSARTLQVELHVDNRQDELLPGAYARVHFRMPGRSGTLRIPASALLFRAAGLQVATLGPDRHVKLKGIVQGRDFGRSVEVLSGLTAGDDVVANPPDSLADGMLVRVAPGVPASRQAPAAVAAAPTVRAP
jgi:RND family efflux transporter MFP subunit